MSSKENKVMYVREFLNENQVHGLGAVLAEITAENDSDIEAYLSLSDCSRMITLDFSVYLLENKDSDLTSAIKKAEKLKRITSDFCKHLKVEVKKLKKKKKKKKK